MNQQDLDAAAMAKKARQSLESAEADFAARRYDSCANRAYFACYQAALSVMIGAGLVRANETISHQTVATLFVEQLVRRRKLFASALAGELPSLMKRRHEADYQTGEMSRGRANEVLRRAR